MKTPSGRDGNPHLWLELFVPLFSFGGAAAAIFAGTEGIPLDFHYPAMGCVVASCVLAYLAWIRPRKDIVALSTPVYAFIFFLVPTDVAVGIILMLLYAVSLTILLVRLKLRFGGKAPVPGTPAQAGPLDRYVDLVRQSFPGQIPGLSRDAATVFIRFAGGDYEGAAEAAASVHEQSGRRADEGPVARAFMAVAEQAGHIATGASLPASFLTFAPEEYPFLFHPLPEGATPDHVYSTTLDNALLLLYAVAAADSTTCRLPEPIRKFAERLSEKR
jgi:hypothetical protein